MRERERESNMILLIDHSDVIMSSALRFVLVNISDIYFEYNLEILKNVLSLKRLWYEFLHN